MEEHLPLWAHTSKFVFAEDLPSNILILTRKDQQHSSYDGVPAAIDKHTLTEVLRDEWGFEGFVESDSGAIAFLCSIFYTCDPSITNNPEAAVRALKAGNDMEMGGQPVSLDNTTLYHLSNIFTLP